MRWLKEAKPDVVCLQELKCTDDAFPAEALAKAGYRSVRRGQRTWNGVAILSRGSEPVVTRTALPGDPDDDQARYLEAAVDGIVVGCIYLPNGNPQPGPKFDYKLAWFRRFNAHARKLLAEKVQGWTDALRKTHGKERIYTFWHYLWRRWERNAGLRLDHILLSPDVAPRLRAAGVDRAVRGRAMRRSGSSSTCRSDADGQRDGADVPSEGFKGVVFSCSW